MDEQGDYIYQKRNEKTNKDIEIVITQTALKILKEYDFNLPKLTNQYFNRELFKILEYYNLFPQIVNHSAVNRYFSTLSIPIGKDLFDLCSLLS